jgi:UDP-N-acetylmuramate: L-alanyl-gamma-D-glutamyl-meso-diaminopimelate ligase
MPKQKKVHFIAIGGAVMHNLALALHTKGYRVTGSDDSFLDPSRSRLSEKGLLPASEGWDADRVSPDLDAVILGMHARSDNPELLKAQQLGIQIFSFPEYLFEQTRDKMRVAVGGSHGKTTITSMVMHVLRAAGKEFDYMVGALLEGFETMVGLSDSAEIAVFEGDEYLASTLDPRPKFHLYRPHIGLISGIAWDHINVFPTWAGYLEQFRIFVRRIEPGGCLVYNQTDLEVLKIANEAPETISRVGYRAHSYDVADGGVFLRWGTQRLPVGVFGRHNMENLSGAKAVCLELGVTETEFYEAITTFRGASKRLQVLAESSQINIYRDFAHAPSKVVASTNAVKELWPARRLVACLELHTFSSLTADFLEQYRGTLDASDTAIVFFDPRTVEQKRLEPIDPATVSQAFAHRNLTVIRDVNELKELLVDVHWGGENLLLMSSGHFSGLDLEGLVQRISTN